MIDNEFTLCKVLGKGGSSKVFLAQGLGGTKWAIKAIRKDKGINPEAAAMMLKREHSLLELLSDHPNIIKSHRVNTQGQVWKDGKTESVIYAVLEFVKNGALSNFVRYTGGVEESIARLFAIQIGSALQYMHQLGYAHMDVKLENILLDEYYNVKLADMGSSYYAFDTQGLINKKRGTLLYMAPEVLNFVEGKCYDVMAADIYSFGVTLFVLISGEFPSSQEIKSNLMTMDSENKNMVNAFMEDEKNTNSKPEILSKNLRNLVQLMTHSDPKKRPTIREVLDHAWFTSSINDELLEEAYSEMNARKEFMLKLISKNM